ncbi:MAG: DUF2934 domain-containing protein [Geminicoccaceae bacterium]
MPKIEESKSVTSGPKGGARSAAATTKRAARATGSTRTASRRAPAGRLPADLREMIRQRAYELWEREGRPEGREQAHWQQAELELAKARSQRLSAAEG